MTDDLYLARARMLEGRTRDTIARELSLSRLTQAKEHPARANGIFHVTEGPAQIMREALNPSLTVVPTPATTPMPLARPPQAPIRPTHERVTLADSIPRVTVQHEETAARIAGGENVPRLGVAPKPVQDHANPGDWFRQRTLHDAANVREKIGPLAGAPDRVRFGIPWGAGPRNPRWGENE